MGYKKKYPRIRPDQKTYFLRNEAIDKKLFVFLIWLLWLKIGVPRAKIGFGFKTKYPILRSDQKTYFLKSNFIDKKL